MRIEVSLSKVQVLHFNVKKKKKKNQKPRDTEHSGHYSTIVEVIGQFS